MLCLTECARVMRETNASPRARSRNVDADVDVSSDRAERRARRLDYRATALGSTFRGQSQRGTESHAELSLVFVFVFVFVLVLVHVHVPFLSPPVSSSCFSSCFLFVLCAPREKSR